MAPLAAYGIRACDNAAVQIEPATGTGSYDDAEYRIVAIGDAAVTASLRLITR